MMTLRDRIDPLGPPLITNEGTWLVVHRGPEADDQPWFYVTDCGECLGFSEMLEESAMSADLWVQRGKVLLAFGRAHHSGAFSELRPWVFLHELKMAGWPDECLREVAELAFDAGLDHAGDRREIIVRESRIIGLVGETYAERRRRHGN
jgi:hypothetical protein